MRASQRVAAVAVPTCAVIRGNKCHSMALWPMLVLLLAIVLPAQAKYPTTCPMTALPTRSIPGDCHFSDSIRRFGGTVRG